MFWLTGNAILQQEPTFTIWEKDKSRFVIVSQLKSAGWKGQWFY